MVLGLVCKTQYIGVVMVLWEYFLTYGFLGVFPDLWFWVMLNWYGAVMTLFEYCLVYDLGCIVALCEPYVGFVWTLYALCGPCVDFV